MILKGSRETRDLENRVFGRRRGDLSIPGTNQDRPRDFERDRLFFILMKGIEGTTTDNRAQLWRPETPSRSLESSRGSLRETRDLTTTSARECNVGQFSGEDFK
jgi:hypothetical protein